MAEADGDRGGFSSTRRQALHYAGYAIILVAFAYLFAALARTEFVDALAALSLADMVTVTALSLLYLVLLGLLAQAWTSTASGICRLPWQLAVRVYGLGVIAKYVPGSVLQYASRHILGTREGWTQKAMLRASIAEALLHCVCAALAGAAVAFGGGALGGGLACLAGAALTFSARRPLVRAAGLQICAFAGLALCVHWLSAGILSLPAAPQIVGAFMAAWIAGFLVPAAPGGIGVRETTFMLLANGLAPATDLAVLAILVRAVTTFGDAGFGLLAYGLSLDARRKRHASA